MKDLQKLFRECVLEMKSINMDISNRITEVKINGRLRTVLGRCAYNYRTGNYSIEINPCLLTDEAETQAVKETLIHELIHTCPGCMNHGYEWKRRGDRVNRMLGYNVCRLRSVRDLEAWNVKLNKENWKYALVCNNCGNQYRFKRWCKKLEYSSLYNCSCGGRLHAISLDGSRQIWSAANKCK